MIYVTGDTHGEYGRLSKRKLLKSGIELTENDYVIVCGDFGLCWERNATFEYECKLFEKRPFTILWVQGNHENYDMISEFPAEEWHGGKVRHIVRDKVILLERGQVFTIENKTFFTFGGAASHDIQGGVLERNDPDFRIKVKNAIEADLPFRVLGESWWPQELPTQEEMEEGLRNLRKVNHKVDYIITHCCSSSVQRILDSGSCRLFREDILTDYLQQIEENVEFQDWYFGHYHLDIRMDDKHILLYEAVIPVKQ